MHRLSSARLAAIIAPLSGLFALASAPLALAGAKTATRPPAVRVDMRNVDLHVAEHVTLRVHSLVGRFVPAGSAVPNLDHNGSYVVEVDAGEVAIGEASLNALLNEHVFGHGKPPIRNLHVRVEDGQLEQTGALAKGIEIPFKVTGAVEPTPDGRIRIRAKSIRSLGLPVKPLLKLLGLDLAKLVKLEAAHGLTADENDFIIDPQKMLPPPRLRGRVTAVRIEGDELVQRFGTGPIPAPPAGATAPNHIYWQGGFLQFGKLTMRDTDLELIDQAPSDPFDFSVARYNDMLVAGYSKTVPGGGLKTYMPDYGKLGAKASTARP